MITVDLAAVRNRIKTNLADAIHGLEVYDYEPKTPHHPIAVVAWPTNLNPRATQAGDIDVTIPVRFEVVWLGDESSDQALMDLMEAAVNAIESDRDLNGNVDDLSCGPFTDIGARTLNDDRVVMQFVVPVEILA